MLLLTLPLPPLQSLLLLLTDDSTADTTAAAALGPLRPLWPREVLQACH